MCILSRGIGWLAVVAVVAMVPGCAAIKDPADTQAMVEGVAGRDAADRAFVALGKGDFAAAERLAISAVRYNPKEPLGLLVAGLAYQGLGRYDLARQYYEVIITNQSPGTVMITGDGGVLAPRSIMDVAKVNLAVVDKALGRNNSRGIQDSGRPPGVSAVGAPPLPSIEPVGLAASLRPMVGAQNMEMLSNYTPGRVSDAEANVAGRFRILKRLLDEGLITPEEYGRRRMVNLGGLLPFSQSAPGVGLERPIPQEQSVVQRLRDLALALEARGVSPTEHASERATILDALLAAQPRKQDMAPPPPKDMLEASQYVGRLERMKSAGLVTDAEARKEKDAIDKVLDSQLAGYRVNGGLTGLKAASASSKPAAAVSSGAAAKASSWGVVLASAASEADAQSAWQGIKAKFPEELGGKDAQIKKGGKAGKYRVLVGPLASKDAARSLCKTLKLHRQACDPVTM